MLKRKNHFGHTHIIDLWLIGRGEVLQNKTNQKSRVDIWFDPQKNKIKINGKPIDNWFSIWKYLGTDDETQEYDHLGAWGPRFDKLANMYGTDQIHHHELDEL